MKEFSSQKGGRFVYVDDMLNLQDLALAFSHIFDDCDNFIISGCEVSGNAISEGYVYLNGKIRKFNGASSITTWPQYLYENNTIENVYYKSGATQAGRTIYGVLSGSSVPSTADSVTSKAPTSIEVPKSGGIQMKDAFFGKYALLLSPANLSQVLNGSLKIGNELSVTGKISTNDYCCITNNKASFNAGFDVDDLVLNTKYADNSYSINIKDGGGISLNVNDSAILTITDNGAVSNSCFQSSMGVFGNVGVSTDGIYNRSTATDNGVLNINMVGFDGASQYYRNTVIGNGKNTAIISVNGQDQMVEINGVETLASAVNGESLVFLANASKTDNSIQKTIAWKDSNKEVMGVLGFTQPDDATFRITNNLAGVYVYGATNSFVDLGPAIKENGQLLSDKYAQTSDIENVKADIKERAKISSYLSDMATTDDIKKQIRTNIGAAGLNEFQPILKDTGWIAISASGGVIRQIGSIVSVQGFITLKTTEALFTIPPEIDPPASNVHAVHASYTGTICVAEIDANSRVCKANVSKGDGWNCNFTMIYMV